MEYRHLKYFIAVAEELSFTRASARLRVAQPHLSREIRRLEEELEVPLFARDRRRVMLTAGGSAFLQSAYRILEETAEAVHTAKRAHRGQTGRVRIGFSTSAGLGVLPHAVRRFRQEWPEIELALTEYNSDEQPDLIRGGALDAGLLYPPLRAEEGLSTETLVADPLLAALPQDHPLGNRQKIALEALADEPWIFFPRAVASRLHDEIIHACREAGFTPRVVQEALKLSTIASLVASGLGTCLVPITLARLRLPGTIYRPLVSPLQVPLTLMHRRNDPNPALAMVIETIRSEARLFTAQPVQQPQPQT
ncbi:LysR family transcriptional regulator [Chelatococcus sp. GCM10030263]|uniref:LysR family transcriptional regulator n=1 Tax=Chelatococcus sp. GCM10030263 TaxID=3273387 RepID=UPI003618AA5C